jgi:hypothetical protein
MANVISYLLSMVYAYVYVRRSIVDGVSWCFQSCLDCLVLWRRDGRTAIGIMFSGSILLGYGVLR